MTQLNLLFKINLDSKLLKFQNGPKMKHYGNSMRKAGLILILKIKNLEKLILMILIGVNGNLSIPIMEILTINQREDLKAHLKNQINFCQMG